MGFKTWYTNQQARHDAYLADQAEKKIDARVPKPTRREVKRATIDIGTKKGARQLAKLLADGWEIQSEHKRSIAQWKPAQVDYVLTRTQGGYY